MDNNYFDQQPGQGQQNYNNNGGYPPPNMYPNMPPEMPQNRPDGQRRRKRVSQETLRKRQLGALCVIAFLVLMLIILTAKACSKSSNSKKGGDTAPAATQSETTTSITTTAGDLAAMTTSATTTTKSADPTNTSGFKLDKYTVRIDVGDSAMVYVQEYPDGTVEADERWSSDNDKIATVNEWGNITAVAPGTCYVTLKSAADPTQEVQIKVVVADDGSLQQTSNPNDNEKDKEPQSERAEAPAPSKINLDGCHYEGDVLIVNKSYSIPADYNPGSLDPTCSEWFNKLVEGAKKDGINIYLSSGFRSYGYQSDLYNGYCNDYGQATADTFSARPGYSEHQTGLAIDVNIVDDSFTGTPEAQWIEEHCYEYGFILRYPQGKESVTGYKYEPWHIRYVGTEVSYKIHEMGPTATLEELYNLTSKYN